jgi:hypothetical protein
MAVTVAVGGRTVALDSSDGEWRELAGQRYRDFAVAGDGEARIEYQLRRRSNRLGPASLARARRLGVELGRSSARGWGFSASWRDGGRMMGVEGPCHTYPIDLLLPPLWYELEPAGVLVHGVLLEIGGRGVVGIGPSGRGKSTLARLAGERSLCDEIVAVVQRGQRLYASSLPFWAGRPGECALDEILLLEHGLESRRVPLDPRVAMVELARQVIWPPSPVRAAAALELVMALASEVAVSRFPFRPEPEALEVLAA